MISPVEVKSNVLHTCTHTKDLSKSVVASELCLICRPDSLLDSSSSLSQAPADSSLLLLDRLRYVQRMKRGKFCAPPIYLRFLSRLDLSPFNRLSFQPPYQQQQQFGAPPSFPPAGVPPVGFGGPPPPGGPGGANPFARPPGSAPFRQSPFQQH